MREYYLPCFLYLMFAKFIIMQHLNELKFEELVTAATRYCCFESNLKTTKTEKRCLKDR